MPIYTTLADYLAPKKLGTIIYYGPKSSLEAVEMAKEMRANKEIAMVRDGSVFDGVAEHCKAVIVMPDLHERHRAYIEDMYGDKIVADKKGPVAVQETESMAVDTAPVKRGPGRPRKVVNADG